MPPIQRGSLRIKNPSPPLLIRNQNDDNDFTNEDALRIARAQLKRYENDPDWNTSENRNEAIEFLKYQTIPKLLRQIENRKPMCKKVTNTVTGTVRSVCGIQRHRIRKNRRNRKLTLRIR